MINLLPPETKQGYRYAGRNVVLRNWLFAFVLAFVGLGVIATYGLLAIKQSTDTYSRQIAATEKVFSDENFTGTQKNVQDISNNLKLVVQVLGQEVLFSKLISQIAATIPKDSSLTGLNISQTQGAIDISAVAKDYDTATQVQVNLADPANKIFTKADIISIACGSTSAQSATYPCTVNIRALFASNNPFLFIGTTKGAK